MREFFMIMGIGADIVDVQRFERLLDNHDTSLHRIFTKQEILACSGPDRALRLAARFAAKEAFYKALSVTLVDLGVTQNTFTFLFLCPLIFVSSGPFDIPILRVDWKNLEEKLAYTLPSLKVHLSLSHEKTHALAFVIISKE